MLLKPVRSRNGYPRIVTLMTADARLLRWRGKIKASEYSGLSSLDLIEIMRFE